MNLVVTTGEENSIPIDIPSFEFSSHKQIKSLVEFLTIGKGEGWARTMSPSTASPLEDLPLIVLENICAYLAQCACKRSCLRAFSLTSWRCCSAAAAQRFCQIRLTVRGRNELRDDLGRWSQVLSIGGRFRCVRRLKILGGGQDTGRRRRRSPREPWCYRQ